MYSFSISSSPKSEIFLGHNAPLYRREEEEPETSPGWYFNVFDTIQVYLDGGVPANQIVMGMPTYGRGFVLNNTEENGLYCGAHAGTRVTKTM